MWIWGITQPLLDLSSTAEGRGNQVRESLETLVWDGEEEDPFHERDPAG